MSPTNRQAAESWTLREAQARVDQWIKSKGVRYFSELTNLAQLVEEVGEVARILSRTYGEQSFKETEQPHALADELADVLFVVCCLANQTGIDLQGALEANLVKKTQRDATRHLQNTKLHAPQPQVATPGDAQASPSATGETSL